jgi:hypothetical protein
VEDRIPVEKSSRALAVTNRRVIKREELVGERNRKEGKNGIKGILEFPEKRDRLGSIFVLLTITVSLRFL